MRSSDRLSSVFRPGNCSLHCSNFRPHCRSPTVEPRMSAAEGRSCPFIRPRHLCVLHIALPLDLCLFLRLTPSRAPTKTKAGPKGRERDLARPPAGTGTVPSRDPLRRGRLARGPVRATAQAQMALVTFAETKVTRRTGPAPR